MSSNKKEEKNIGLAVAAEVAAWFEAPAPTHGKKKVLVSLLVIVFLVAGFGTYGLLRYKGSFGNVYVASVDIEQSTPAAQLEATATKALSDFQFTISDKDNKITAYSGQEVGITFDIPKTVKLALAKKDQRDILEGLKWWQQETVPMELVIDENKLAGFIDDKTTQITEAPANATLTVESGKVVVTSEKAGKGYMLTQARDALIASAKAAMPQVFKLTSATIRAPVIMKDIEPLKTKIETALKQSIVFTIHGHTFKPDQATIGNWVEPINLNNKRANLEYNSGGIQAYIDTIAKPYVQLPRSQVTMANPDGTTAVIITGKNGTDVKNKQDISTEVATRLLAMQPIEENLIVDDAPYGTVTAQTYDKWLVIDLTNKRMDAYEGSNLIRSFKISAGAPATPTVLGQFKIYAKVRKQDMRGLSVDGSSYFQPDVEWANYFYGSYAIHGNYWRPNYWFGSINSSHGCVGVTNVDGEWIYNWAPVGTPVITHL